MPEEPQYYSPPVAHQQHLSKMIVFLVAFFSGLAILVGTFIYFAPRLLVHLPIEAEQRFVQPYEELSGYLQRNYGEQASAERLQTERYLQSLSDRLGEASDLPARMQLKVHLINSEMANAFATLGGHVFVCRGLLDSIQDENGLAMVLAHEIAHIKHRDPVVSMSRGLALQLMYSFVTGDYSRRADWVIYGGDLGLLFFSREQESKADAQALSALQRHYGHIAGYTQFFSIISQAENDGAETDPADELAIPEWLSSHPDLRDRIADLEQQARRNRWQTGIATPLPAEMEGWLQSLRAEERSSKAPKPE